MTSRFRYAVAAGVIALSLATVSAQKAAAPAPEVFCNTMQAGTLCPTGTVSILKLSGPKGEQWLGSVNRDKGAVESATKQLKAEAKSVLTPAQIAELDRWMASGINPEVNRILASRNPIAR